MKSFKILSLFAAASMVLAACGGSAPSPTAAPAAAAPAAPAPTEAPKPTEAPAVPTEAAKPTEAPKAAAMPAAGSPGKEYDDALAGKLKGTKVSIFGPFGDQDEVKFNNTIKAFEDKTGIDIVYEGSKEMEVAITVRVESGNTPDIADFPQPGLMARFAKSGKIIDANTMVDPAYLKANYNQSLLDILTVDGPSGKINGGLWERINGKSLVWYPKKAFDEAGYKTPTTYDELKALEQQIVKDGDAPWCIGIESGGATGWAATDWMEEFMLRTTSLENYDKWTRGELPFSSPEVKNAANEMARIWFDDKLVYGGRKSIASTSFGDAPKAMFDKDGPKCWLHKQGNFITSFFPPDVKAGVDYDFFYLPGIDAKYGKPFLFAGDLMAAFKDRPEVRAVMQLFAKGEHLKGWMAAGGAIAPQKDADLKWYSNDIERKVGQFVQEATSLRFDGSDLMPGEVGAGSFWKGMTDWVSGVTDLDKVMTEIDASWPKNAAMSGGAMAAATSPGKEYDEALKGAYKGTKVSIFGPFGDQDEVKFNNTIKAFEDATGIDIVYEGSKEMEVAITVRVESGNIPDIADFPQPGLMARFAKSGKIIDANTMVDPAFLKANYNQSLLDILTVDGPSGKISGGLWERINGKSLVWYPKKAFDEAGYKTPTTWAELEALQQQIVKDGDAPWCIGIESGGATGWAATDWMEEIMLRTTSLENYDKWTRGELKFASPEVKFAAETMAKIWFDDKLVNGGRKSIASTSFGDAPKAMFDKDGPKCWLHKQGNFITSFFPPDVKAGVDYDFFYLPGIDEKYGKPFLFAGDLMAAFKDRPEVRAVMQLFAKGEHLKGWMAAGGAIAPQKDADLKWYSNDIERKVGQFVQEATSLRFDGSDLMPGEVGAGSFWKGMTDWVSGVTDLDKALSEIDAAWPKK